MSGARTGATLIALCWIFEKEIGFHIRAFSVRPREGADFLEWYECEVPEFKEPLPVYHAKLRGVPDFDEDLQEFAQKVGAKYMTICWTKRRVTDTLSELELLSCAQHPEVFR